MIHAGCMAKRDKFQISLVSFQTSTVKVLPGKYEYQISTGRCLFVFRFLQITSWKQCCYRLLWVLENKKKVFFRRKNAFNCRSHVYECISSMADERE